MNPESIWILLGVLFLGGAIGFYASRKPRPSDVGEERLRGNYLAGVNFLVNEQPDRALEAFLRAAELDDDTIETHFALGSLYRRRGELEVSPEQKYRSPHNTPEGFIAQPHMPEPRRYYEPTGRGFEAELAKRLKAWRAKMSDGGGAPA